MRKKTFLFLYKFLVLGGIESNIIEMIQTYNQMNMRIVWLRYGNEEDIFEPWKKVLQECDVEIIQADILHPNWLSFEGLSFGTEEEIIAVAFDPSDFVRLESIAHMFNNRFDLFYIVPHFETALNYVEEYYILKRNRTKMVEKLKPLYKKWYENGNLLFFNKKHAEEMQKRYGIVLNDLEGRILKRSVTPPEFDENRALIRAKRTQFRIISCGRFDFPHKGYMFGLIDAFAKLKIKYPNVYLDLVGYGTKENEDRIREYVNKFDSKVKKDIVFYGSVSPQNLMELFNKAHVNVSVAGAICDGAISGLVSIPARHYTYECQVYGWLEEDFSIVLSDKEGENVVPYIEKMINMSEQEYVDVCRKSYLLVHNELYDQNWLLNRKNVEGNYYSEEDEKLFKKINKYRDCKFKLKCRLDDIFKPFLNRLGLYEKIMNAWENFKNI